MASYFDYPNEYTNGAPASRREIASSIYRDQQNAETPEETETDMEMRIRWEIEEAARTAAGPLY